MTSDDERAATHLRRLGVSPVTVQHLIGLAEKDETSVRQLVAYILSDYVRHVPPDDDA